MALHKRLQPAVVAVVAVVNSAQDDPTTTTRAQQEPHKVLQDKAKVPVTEPVVEAAEGDKTVVPAALLLVVTMVLLVVKMATVWRLVVAQFRVALKQVVVRPTQQDPQVLSQSAFFPKLPRCQH
jgi:hypothetical protein